MFCTKCGAYIPDDATFCPSCGCTVAGSAATGAYPHNDKAGQSTYPARTPGIRIAAKIVMLVGAIATAVSLVWSGLMSTSLLNAVYGGSYAGLMFIYVFLGLISLAWTIPMTVHYWRAVRNHEPVSTAFKICTILFVSAPAGILMLIDQNR